MIYDESHDLLLLRLSCVWVLVDIVRGDFEMVSKLNYNSNWYGKSKFDLKKENSTIDRQHCISWCGCTSSSFDLALVQGTLRIYIGGRGG